MGIIDNERSHLNDQQFAQYSALEVPHPIHEYTYKPLPASMERHAPGEYQPTLPGMEKMLKGEQTSTEVFFKKPNAFDYELGDVPGSTALEKDEPPRKVTEDVRNLHPTQQWVADAYVHSPDKPSPYRNHGQEPDTERIGNKTVLHDGHHRVVRGMLSGKQFQTVNRWDA